MSGRLLSTRLRPLAQRVNTGAARHFHHHTTSSAGGLLKTDSAVRAARRRIWPAGYTAFSNAVIVRNASFVRILPKLLLKFARIPALFGGATIAGLAYVQYQATRRFYITPLLKPVLIYGCRGYGQLDILLFLMLLLFGTPLSYGYFPNYFSNSQESPPYLEVPRLLDWHMYNTRQPVGFILLLS